MARWRNSSKPLPSANSAVIEYHNSSSNDHKAGSDASSSVAGEEEASFLKWIFHEPFRCKTPTSEEENEIAVIFSKPGMPSAADILCGSMMSAMNLERIVTEHITNISDVCFESGSGAIIRFGGGDEVVLPVGLAGEVSEGAFNTFKKICGFKQLEGKCSDDERPIFTKQPLVTCPSGLHGAELWMNINTNNGHRKEEIRFRVHRHNNIANKIPAIVDEIYERFYCSPGSDTQQLKKMSTSRNRVRDTTMPDMLLIIGPSRSSSGKTTVLREFRKKMSCRELGTAWNIIHLKHSFNDSKSIKSSIREQLARKQSIGPTIDKLHHVIFLDDLSVGEGIAFAHEIIATFGIHVIASIGNESSLCGKINVGKEFSKGEQSIKTMVLEIILNRESTSYKFNRNFNSDGLNDYDPDYEIQTMLKKRKRVWHTSRFRFVKDLEQFLGNAETRTRCRRKRARKNYLLK